MIRGLCTLAYDVGKEMSDETSKREGRKSAQSGMDADLLREQLGMFEAEMDDRQRDAILTDQERVRDLSLFKKCVSVAGSMDQDLFCSTILPG